MRFSLSLSPSFSLSFSASLGTWAIRQRDGNPLKIERPVGFSILACTLTTLSLSLSLWRPLSLLLKQNGKTSRNKLRSKFRVRVCVRVCVCVCENAHKYFQLQIVFFRLDKQNLWQFQQLIADRGGPQRPFPSSTPDRDRDQDRRPKTSGCPARTPSILLRLQTLLRLAGDAVVNKATKRTERERKDRER